MERRARCDSDECPDDFKCSITLEVMRDPVLLVSSGITYERSSLMEALERRPNVDPQTNAAFEGPPVVAANVTLKRAIEAWRSRPGRPAEEERAGPPLTALQWREAESDPLDWVADVAWEIEGAGSAAALAATSELVLAPARSTRHDVVLHGESTALLPLVSRGIVRVRGREVPRGARRVEGLRLHLRNSGMAFVAKVALSSEVVALVGGNDNLLFALYGGDAARQLLPPPEEAAPMRSPEPPAVVKPAAPPPAVVKARPPPAVVKAPPPRPPPAVAKRALVVEKQQQLADSERRLEKQLKQLPPAPAASSSDGSRYPPASMDESQRRAFTNIVRFMDAASAAEARDAITRRTSRGPVRDAAAWALASVERFRDEPDIKVVRMPKDVDAALVKLRAIHEVRVSDFALETVRDLVLLLEPDAAVEIIQELCEWDNIDDADKALDDLISERLKTQTIVWQEVAVPAPAVDDAQRDAQKRSRSRSPERRRSRRSRSRSSSSRSRRRRSRSSSRSSSSSRSRSRSRSRSAGPMRRVPPPSRFTSAAPRLGATALPALDSVHRGVVIRLLPGFGAFVRLEGPYDDGLVHVSHIRPGGGWVHDITECLSVNDQVYCSVLGIKPGGKIEVSMSNVDQSTGALLFSIKDRLPNDVGGPRVPHAPSLVSHAGAIETPGHSSYLPSAQQPTSRISFGFAPDRELGLDFEFDSDVGRLVVTKVQDGSQATACPLLCAGMVVVAVNGFAVSSLDDFESQIVPLRVALERINIAFEERGAPSNSVVSQLNVPALDSASGTEAGDALKRQLVNDLHAWLVSKRQTCINAPDLAEFLSAHPQYKKGTGIKIKHTIVGFGAPKLHWSEDVRGFGRIDLGPAPRPSVVEAKADLSEQQVPQLNSIHRGVITELLPNVGALVALRGPFGAGLVPMSRIGPGGTPMVDFAQQLSVGSAVCCSVSEISRYGKFELTMSSVEAQERQLVDDLHAWLVLKRMTEVSSSGLVDFLSDYPQFKRHAQSGSIIKSAIEHCGEGKLYYANSDGRRPGASRVALVPGSGSVVSASPSSSPRSPRPRSSPEPGELGESVAPAPVESPAPDASKVQRTAAPRRRERSPSPDITCIHCGKVGSRASGFKSGNFCEAACQEAHGRVEVRVARVGAIHMRGSAARKNAADARKRPRTAENPSD